jgi:YbbR domain-containing protein
VSKTVNKDAATVRESAKWHHPASIIQRLITKVATGSLRHNIGMRILSLFLAVGLWIFVNAGQRGSLQSFNVPLSYRNLPPHFLITSPHPESITIEVSGPRTLLSIIDANRLTVKLNLTGVGVGQASFKIGPEAFNLPRMTTLTSISPSSIVLDLDRIVTREVPVRLVTTGPIVNGYRIASTEANPRTVTIRGPSKDLARIAQVGSEPIQLADLTSNIARMVALDAPSATVRIDPSEVAANIVVSPIEVDKQFHKLRIQVRNNAYPVRIQPVNLSVTIHGPELLLEQAGLENAVYVDADGLAPGSYEVPLQMTLPEGVKLVHQSVTKVRLRLYRDKRTMQG